MPVDSQSDTGSIRNAIRWGLLLAAVATAGYRLPRLFGYFRHWREALRIGDVSSAAGWRTYLTVEGLGLLMVLAMAWVIFYVLQPRGNRQP